MGKTSDGCGHHRQYRKHPHGRGEDRRRKRTSWPCSETPPRAWGRRPRNDPGHCQPGNTPTGVGKTHQQQWQTSSLWKHPHGRGEEHPAKTLMYTTSETPPRAWGRRSLPGLRGVQCGNTPTGVGKTAAIWLHVTERQKHPHGRGEDIVTTPSRAISSETPPRAWGRRSPRRP